MNGSVLKLLALVFNYLTLERLISEDVHFDVRVMMKQTGEL